MRNGPASRICIALGIVLCLFATFKVVYQAIPRMRSCWYKQNDIQPLYLSSRVWAAGRNPYDVVPLAREMNRSNARGMRELHGICEEDCNVYYPPTALPLFAAVSWLPWPTFLAVFVFACVGSYIASIWFLSRLLPFRDLRFLFLSLGIAFSPFYSGLGTCNVSELLVPAILLSALCGESMWAAFIFGLITCVKPPLGILYFAWYLARGRFRQATTFTASVCLVAIVSLFRLRGIPWLPTYKAALIHFSPATDGPGGVATHGVANAGFLNLEALFYVLTGDIRLAVVWNYGVLLLALGSLAFFLWSNRAAQLSLSERFTAFALLCCLTLLQSTLQYYNGVLILAPAIYALWTPSSRSGLLVGIPAFSFVLPPRWFLLIANFRGHTLRSGLNSLQTHQGRFSNSLSSKEEIAAIVPSVLVTWIAGVLLVDLFTMRRTKGFLTSDQQMSLHGVEECTYASAR